MKKSKKINLRTFCPKCKARRNIVNPIESKFKIIGFCESCGCNLTKKEFER